MKLHPFLLIFLILSCSAPNSETKTDADTSKIIDSASSDDTIARTKEEYFIEARLNDNYPVEINNTNLELRYDTVINREYLRKNLELIYTIKLPTLKRKDSHPTVLFYNDSIQVKIVSSKFQKKNREVSFNGALINNIDGRYPWGVDGNEPTSEIKLINVTKFGKSIVIEDSLYADLFEPSLNMCDELENGAFCYTNAYVSPIGEIIIQMMNSDGAGAYTVFLFINPDDTIERIVGHSF